MRNQKIAISPTGRPLIHHTHSYAVNSKKNSIQIQAIKVCLICISYANDLAFQVIQPFCLNTKLTFMV